MGGDKKGIDMTTSAATLAKRSVGFLLGMSSLMLGANLVWVSYNTVLLPTLVENVVTASRGLVVGLIGFFGTLLAILVSILWGIISDHTSSKLGKRTPAILTGALLALPLIGLPMLILYPGLKDVFFSLALPIIIVSYLGMQFFTNVGNGAWWPLLVDVVPENQRGLAGGIQGFFTLIGAAIGVLVVTSLNQNGQTAGGLWLIGAVFAFTGIINAVVIHGKDRPAPASERISAWKAMGDMFKVKRRIAVFFWLVGAVLLANMGINSLQFFARYFFEVYVPSISPDAGFRLMGAVSLVLTMLSAVGTGLLSDKIGRRNLLLWGIFASALGTLLMGLTGNFTLFLVFVALRSIATGPIMAIAPALASDLAPRDEAGRYMAYNNLSTGLSGALSSLVFGILLTNLNRITFMYLFIISAILFFAGGVLFSGKVSQEALEARFAAVSQEASEIA
jgi:MFS family permease